MRTHVALLLAAVFAWSPLDGIAEEKQIADVRELAGSWQGWITRDEGQERATLFVSADGSYRALTKDGASTERKFYLQTARCGIARRGRPERPVSPTTRARLC